MPATDTNSACMDCAKIRAVLSPDSPANARPRNGAYTWILPSAITSAPSLTIPITIKSAFLAYTCCPVRTGLLMTSVGRGA